MGDRASTLPAVVQRAVAEQGVDTTKVNLMLPTQTFGQIVGEYDKIVIEVVTVDSDPAAGEVAPVGDKKSLGRVPLEKIASAVGMIWDPAQTTIIESSERKSRAKATAALRKPNGEWIVLSEEKTVDLDAFEEEQRLSIEEKAEKGNFTLDVAEWGTSKSGKRYPLRFPPWKDDAERQRVVDLAVRKAMLSFRKFKDERAMTGAKERVIRAILAIKSAYTDDELSRPFAFPRVIPDTSKMLADPGLRASAIARMTGSSAELFGPGNGRGKQTEPRDVTPEAVAAIADPEQVAATEEREPTPEAPDPFDAVVEKEAEPTAEERACAVLEEWLLSDALKSHRTRSGNVTIDPKTLPAGMGTQYATAYDAVKALLDRRQDATLEHLQAMVVRCNKIGGQA